MQKITTLLCLIMLSCGPKLSHPVQVSVNTGDFVAQEAEEVPEKVMLVLDGVVDDDSVEPIIAKMKELDKQGVKEIWLRLNTPGGSIYSGFRLVQEIESLNAKSVCVVDTSALSMGFYILQSCQSRLMTKRAVIMSHEPLVQSTGGNARDLHNTEEALRVLTNSLIEQSISRMKISKEEFHKHIDGGQQWWMSWEEALKVGAIDGTINPKDHPSIVEAKKNTEDLDSLLKRILR